MESEDLVESFRSFEEEEGRPLPLVSYDPVLRQFNVNPQALDFLRTLQAPLGVAAVAGMYRTGKSYLLNRVLLDTKDGFGVGPTVNPCTKGLWIWAAPIRGTTEEGEPCTVLVIDSEGIGALDEDSTHDSRVFALAILLASVFIYNSVGSIDEDALQNLSLVATLTKHIHVKSQGEVQEDLATYFPSFLWVVRDFTLQLIDESGKQLTSYEYLEKALLPQRGSSETTEEKNRIRNLLRTYFRKRDCFTMVRPTTDESKLQHLAQLRLDQLRPEFSAQVLELRKKVLHKIKTKCLNGQRLSGSMLADMIEVYTKAINNGAVPNIENAWSYICKNEAVKALKTSVSIYEDRLSCLTLPMSKEKLSFHHGEAQSLALKHLESCSLGEERSETSERLMQAINENLEVLKSDNKSISAKLASEFLDEHFGSIRNKMQSFNSYIEFEREMEEFRSFFRQYGPEGTGLEMVLASFCQGASVFAADFFLKKVQSELELQVKVNQDATKSLNSELTEAKSQLVKEREDWEKTMASVTLEKEDLKFKEEYMEKQMGDLRASLEQYEQNMRKITKEHKQALQKQNEEAVNKHWEFEEQVKELQREVNRVEGEKLQEIALLQHKIGYLEQNLHESNSVGTRASNEISALKKEHSQNTKDLSSKYESQIRALQQRLTEETEKFASVEKHILQRENTAEIEKNQLEEVARVLKEQVEDLHTQAERTKAKYERKEENYRAECGRMQGEKDEQISRFRHKVEELETKLKEKETQILTFSANDRKENAVLHQKLEFLQQELDETKELLKNERKHQELIMRSMSEVEFTREEHDLEVQRLKASHEQNIKAIEHEFTDTKQALKLELQALTEANEDLEHQLSNVFVEKQSLSEAFNAKISELSSEKNKLTEKLLELQEEHTSLTEETEATLKRRVSELELQLEDTLKERSRELSLQSESHETVLEQLKAYHSEEKSRLEQRIREEKERGEKRLVLAQEECEGKAREDQEQLEEEIACLQEELRVLNQTQSAELQTLKQQSALDAQKIETLESYLQSNKEQMNLIQQNSSRAMEAQLVNFNNERNCLLERLEKSNSEASLKEREITNYEFKLQQLTLSLQSKERELGDLKEQNEHEKSSLMAKLESFKENNFRIADEYSQKKNDFNKELALARQQIEFANSKIIELENLLEDAKNTQNDEWKLEADKASFEALAQEKDVLQRKLEEINIINKEQETKLTRQVSILEKEKYALADKVNYLEQRKNEAEKLWKAEIQELQEQLDLQNTEKTPSSRYFLDENEKLSLKIDELEKALADTNACYERDRALWDNKFNFLAQQRDQARNDIADSQRRFDIALERLQKKGALDKEKVESATASLISSVEGRHQSQVKEMQDNYQANLQRYTERCKHLEKENRNLREELDFSKRNKHSETFEWKLKEAADKEKLLIAEIDSLKQDRTKKIKEITEAYSYDKEYLKAKVSEAEIRNKEIEHQKSQVFLEHEKEKAKWTLERDQLTSQKNEAQDLLDRLEKRKEYLLRENEKLKNTRTRVPPRRDSAINPNRSFMPSFMMDMSVEGYKEVDENSPKPLRAANLNNLRSYTPIIRESRGRENRYDENLR